MRVLLPAVLLLAACSAPASVTPRPTAPPAPTSAPRPQPTAAPTDAPALDYGAMRAALLTPLGAYLVAARNHDGDASAWRQQFNDAADTVLPQIELDMSYNGNTLHSVIVNTKEAMARGDLATIERERTRLATDLR